MNALPALLLAGLIGAAVLRAAAIFLIWLSVALLLAVLVCNPWRLLDSMIDGKTRGLWSVAVGLMAAAIMIWDLPIRARVICGLCSLPLLWLGWKIKRPAPPPAEAPPYLIQSAEGDKVIGQLASKVTGRGLQEWIEGGKAIVRAVMHQTYTEQITTEFDLDRVGRVSYAVGYERAKSNEAKLEAQITKLKDDIWERDSKIREMEYNYGGYETYHEEVAAAKRELADAKAYIDTLEAELQSRDEMEQERKVLPMPDRDCAIRETVASGVSYRKAAELFGLSKSRVEQICKAG